MKFFCAENEFEKNNDKEIEKQRLNELKTQQIGSNARIEFS